MQTYSLYIYLHIFSGIVYFSHKCTNCVDEMLAERLSCVSGSDFFYNTLHFFITITSYAFLVHIIAHFVFDKIKLTHFYIKLLECIAKNVMVVMLSQGFFGLG